MKKTIITSKLLELRLISKDIYDIEQDLDVVKVLNYFKIENLSSLFSIESEGMTYTQEIDIKHILIYIIKDKKDKGLINLTLLQIAHQFYLHSHTSIIHTFKKINSLKKYDLKLKKIFKILNIN